MITADIFGGLGNQFFIVFATISLAMHNKSNFYFVRTKQKQEEERKDRPTYWNNIFLKLEPFLYTNETKPVFEKEYVYNELEFKYSIVLGNICNKVLEMENDNEAVLRLHGYFQSFQYFSEYYPIIYKLLKIDEQKRELLNYLDLSDFGEYDKTISMHFRIGDYLHQQQNHPVLKKDYYKNAISTMKIMKPSLNMVLYFCEKENIEQVERIVDELKTIFPTMKFILADQKQAIADWQQLLLMSCCANNIIANSTFSWWGAYLNTHPGKIVIYPKTWFGPALSAIHDVSHLFPDEWICIEE
jgi:hypothetical protein